MYLHWATARASVTNQCEQPIEFSKDPSEIDDTFRIRFRLVWTNIKHWLQCLNNRLLTLHGIGVNRTNGGVVAAPSTNSSYTMELSLSLKLMSAEFVQFDKFF